MSNRYSKYQLGDQLIISKLVPLTKETGINHGNEDNFPVAEVNIAIPYVAVVGAHVHNASIDTAVTLTIGAGSGGVLLSAATQNVRFTLDGQTPTDTLGLRLIKDLAPVFISLSGIAAIKVISETAGAAIDYQAVA